MVPPFRRLSSIAFGVQGPSAVSRVDDEVDGEASKCAFRGEPPPDLRGLGADRTGVAEVGRKPASEVLLSGGTAEHLVMRRQQLNVAQRRDSHLDAGAS